ncbi:MAG: (deoxy)nucleoside triphosphate pyrophosphohydrolase [Thermodesulfobacteriota bacterium]
MKTLIVVAGLMVEDGKILVTKRREDSPHGGLWEFPGGKVNEGEEPRQALRRELREELDIDVEVGRIFDAIFEPAAEGPLLLLAFRCRKLKGVVKPLGCADLRWVSLKDLEGLAMPPADDPIRRRLCSPEEEGFL